MRKAILSLAVVFGASAGAIASPVTSSVAQDVAKQFLKGRGVNVQGIKSAQAVENAYYIINFAPSGWVIVSADNTTAPILGYSESSTLNWHSIPSNMRGVLAQYGDVVKENAAMRKAPDRRWSSNLALTARAGVKIEPLIKVQWNQTSPFNKYIPGNMLVGCPAVSLSQAMSVQQWPDKFSGTASYYCSAAGTTLTVSESEERAYNWADILSGKNRYDEAARLLYHAGVAQHMDYGINASGIPSNEVSRMTNALKDNFRYGNDVAYYWRDSYRGDWEQLLINELGAGRAIIYNAIGGTGADTYGHSFNFDGLDDQGYFHVNWGWGGYGDGYFSVNALTDAQIGQHYDRMHVCVIGIGSPNRTLRSMTMSNTTIESGLGAGSAVAQVLVNGEKAQSTFTFDVNGVGGEQVPFTINNEGIIYATNTLNSGETYALEIKVTDSSSKTSLTQGFNFEVATPQPLAKATSISYNRTTGKFSVLTRFNVSYSITNASGQVLRQGSLDLPDFEFSTTDLASGANTLRLTCGNETKEIKIVKK